MSRKTALEDAGDSEPAGCAAEAAANRRAFSRRSAPRCGAWPFRNAGARSSNSLRRKRRPDRDRADRRFDLPARRSLCCARVPRGNRCPRAARLAAARRERERAAGPIVNADRRGRRCRSQSYPSWSDVRDRPLRVRLAGPLWMAEQRAALRSSSQLHSRSQLRSASAPAQARDARVGPRRIRWARETWSQQRQGVRPAPFLGTQPEALAWVPSRAPCWCRQEALLNARMRPAPRRARPPRTGSSATPATPHGVQDHGLSRRQHTSLVEPFESGDAAQGVPSRLSPSSCSLISMASL
jgi:hypothetical protein